LLFTCNGETFLPPIGLSAPAVSRGRIRVSWQASDTAAESDESKDNFLLLDGAGHHPNLESQKYSSVKFHAMAHGD
jgi:hypothetical protein